jgi:hypothetical protein
MNLSAPKSVRCLCVFAIDSSTAFQNSGGYDSSFYYLNELLGLLRDLKIGINEGVGLKFGLAVGDRPYLVNNTWLNAPPDGYDPFRYRQKSDKLNYGVRSAVTTAANQLIFLDDVELPDLAIYTVFSEENPAPDYLDGLRRLKLTPLFSKVSSSMQWVPRPEGYSYDREKLRGVASFLRKDLNDFHDLSTPDKFYKFLRDCIAGLESSLTTQ